MGAVASRSPDEVVARIRGSRVPPRRRRLPAAHAEVHAILARPWLLDAALLEGVAHAAHERADLADPFAGGSGLLLAARLGYVVIARDDVGCGVSGLMPQMLLVRASADDPRWNLRVLHELAHGLLDDAHPHHGHADVWALTLALAIPGRAFRRHHDARHVPRWAVALRRLTSRAVSHG
ncbi:MAG: hypothetical protein JWM10_4067 [Myxococcaceae bacterium]|nr:hypothetical protein [Myxococcaceae bacterium]